MIKVIVKMAIAVLIVNASWRVGSAYLTHYRFTDAIRETTRFLGEKSDAEIESRVFALVSEYDIPVMPDDLIVHREKEHTIVEGSYTRPIDLAPGFVYPWPFSIHTDTFVVRPATAATPAH